MARPSLSPEQIERFRRRLCAVALRRFAEDGYGAVTLRGLASELGCSRGTPYRYFQSKQDIFDAVRAESYESLAAALDLAAISERDPLERVRFMMHAYVRFASEQPYAYRIMFELHQPPGVEVPLEYLEKRQRAWRIWQGEIEYAVQTGHLTGDPSLLAHILWAGVHGAVALHLAGKLVLGHGLEAIASPVIDALLRAHRVDAVA